MLKTLQNRLLASNIRSRMSSVVSPIVMVSIVSESGIEGRGLDVVMDDRTVRLGEDQSTASVGVILIKLAL